MPQELNHNWDDDVAHSPLWPLWPLWPTESQGFPQQWNTPIARGVSKGTECDRLTALQSNTILTNQQLC